MTNKTAANKQVVIDNPIIKSPFAEPQRHFRFDEHGITNQIVAERRSSSYFLLRYLSHRHAGHHHPRPPARAAAR